MEQQSYLVSLDVGTTKVCTIIAQQIEPNALGSYEIIGMGSHPSHGLKKGSVINIGKTVNSIQASIEEATLMSGVKIESAIVGIAGSHIYSFNSTGVVAIKNKEINSEDVERVLEAARAVVIPSDREVLHVIAQEYKVDNISGVKNPIGMYGVRLEVRVHIVTGSVSLIQNLIKCVEKTGIKVSQLSLQPIASSESVLTTDEKEVGTVLIDIGGGTTDVAVWKDGSLVHSEIIPVGGNHFTNDLAVALRVTHSEAERIKINHGSVLPEKFTKQSHITINKVGSDDVGEVSMKTIATVLGLRAEELFNIIKKSILEKNLLCDIHGGIVITGGGSLIDGLIYLGEYNFERSVKIGYPLSKTGMASVMQKPQFSTALGLLNLANVENNNKHVETGTELLNKFSESLKSAFKEIF